MQSKKTIRPRPERQAYSLHDSRITAFELDESGTLTVRFSNGLTRTSPPYPTVPGRVVIEDLETSMFCPVYLLETIGRTGPFEAETMLLPEFLEKYGDFESIQIGSEYYGLRSLHWDGLLRLRGAETLRVWTLDLYFEGDMIYVEESEEA